MDQEVTDSRLLSKSESRLNGVMATALTSQIRCELCGSRKSSEWKCYECSQVMCKRCKKLHIKANISKYHKFVSLKQSHGGHNDRCPNHPSETCTKECTTCGQFVCDMCIQQKHRGHHFLFIHQAIAEMREMCQRNLSDVKEVGLSIALKEMETFRQLGDEYKAKTQTLLKEVTSRYSKCVAMVKDLQNDLLHQIQSLYKLDMGYYETEGKLRQNLILEMEDIIQNFQEGISADIKGIKGLLKLRVINRKMMEMMTPSHIEEKRLPKLSHGEVNTEILRERFGVLTYDVQSHEKQMHDDLLHDSASGRQNGHIETPRNCQETTRERKIKALQLCEEADTRQNGYPNSPRKVTIENHKDNIPQHSNDGKVAVQRNTVNIVNQNTKDNGQKSTAECALLLVPTRNEKSDTPRNGEQTSGEENLSMNSSCSSDSTRKYSNDVTNCDDLTCRISIEFSRQKNVPSIAQKFLQNSVARNIVSQRDSVKEVFSPVKTKDSIFLNSRIASKGNISIHDTFFSELFYDAPCVEKICHVYLQGRSKVCSVCPVGDKAWVGFSDKSVALVNGQGDVLRRSRVDILPMHLTASYSGDVVICSENMCTLKSMSPTGLVKELHRFSVETGGVYVTRQGNTLVTLPALSKVISLSQCGDIDTDIRYDDNGGALFNYPYSITETIDGNICVIDGKSSRLREHSQYIVCVDMKTLVFRYKCEPKTDFQHIACDQYSNIILSDPSNYNIKMLNRNGDYIGVLGRDSFLLVEPRCVVFDEHFNLWVVNDKNRLTVAKYIIN